MRFIFMTVAASFAASVLAKIDLARSRIHGVDELGSDVHQSSFGSDVDLQRDATLQYTFYTTFDSESVTPDTSVISFIDQATGEYWEDVVGIRDSDGRGRFTLVSVALSSWYSINPRTQRSAKFPLKTSSSLDVKLFVAANGESSAFDIGTLSFSGDAAATKTSDSFAPLPEITHTFRTEPKTTPAAISGVAAIFANALPCLVLIGLVSAGCDAWIWLTRSQLSSIKLNLKQSSSNLAFIGTILAFEGLLVTYWVKLTLFQLIPFAVLNGFAVFLSGNQALRALKNRRLAV